MQTKEQALAQLKAKCAWDKQPDLSGEDLLRILDANSRYTDYPAEGTAVEIDTRVRPANSRRIYKCVRAGVIGTALASPLDTVIFSSVGDGTATWQDCGPAPANRYDVNGAAHDAWMEKAAKASELFDFAQPGQNVSEAQVYDHCVSMASRFKKVFVV